MADLETWNEPFKTLPSRAEQFLRDMLERLPVIGSGKRMDVLDLGCGTGAPALQLARTCPGAHVTGIDISQASIDAAEATRRTAAEAGRLRFIAADYLSIPLGPFDLIYADSCLHLIPASTEQLFGKIANELKPGGHLVFSMPRRCLYNSVLFTLRRGLRTLRCRASDHLILKAATWLHGSDMPAAYLRDRVSYMYIIPERLGGNRLDRQLAGVGLNRLGAFPYPHSSLGQPRHGLWIFQRPVAVALAA